MRSKITIHTAPNFKPCIRVTEPQEHWSVDSPDSDDVRDVLVKGFRELLHNKSNTAFIEFQNNNEYLICPVEDEISYFKGRILNVWVKDSASKESLLEIARLINDMCSENIGITGAPFVTDEQLAQLHREGKLVI